MKEKNIVNTETIIKGEFNSMNGINMYGREFTQEEIDQDFHRFIVGGAWSEFSQLQTDFLVSQGLKPFHRLLDIGCGCMRGGIGCIKYLNSGNYYGFDVNNSLVKAGINEIQKAGLKDKNPHLLVEDSFLINEFNIQFDFMISVSLFTHLPMNHIIRCLNAVRVNLKPGGIYFSSFWEAPTPAYLNNISFSDGTTIITTNYDSDPFHYSFEELRWMADISGLQAELIGDWQHPRDQKMVAFRHN